MKEPNNLKAFLGIGGSKENLGDFKGALDYYSKALSIAYNSPSKKINNDSVGLLHNARGMVFYKLGKHHDLKDYQFL